MPGSAPSLLYFFEHMFLRDAAFGSPEFLNSLNGEVSGIRQGLISNFNRIKGNPNNGLVEKEITLKNDDFSVEKATLNVGKNLIVIKCPIPQKAPETTYIGIVLDNSPRYFVCEYESNEEMKQLYPEKEWKPTYILCEWIQKEHKNYGEIAETKEAFVEGIKKLLSN